MRKGLTPDTEKLKAYLLGASLYPSFISHQFGIVKVGLFSAGWRMEFGKFVKSFRQISLDYIDNNQCGSKRQKRRRMITNTENYRVEAKG